MSGGSPGPLARAATSLVAFQGVSLALVALLREQPGAFGISLDQPRRWLEAACMALAVLGPAVGVLYPLVGVARLDPRGLGGVLLAAGFLAVLPLVGRVVRSVAAVDPRPHPTRGQPFTWLLLLAGAAAVGALTASAAPLVGTLAYLLVFVAVGEEMLFRGVE